MADLPDTLKMLDSQLYERYAANLEAIYGYMLRRLVDVDVRNDARAAEEVIQLLEPLRSSWSELARATRDMSADDPALQSLTEAAGGAGGTGPKTETQPAPKTGSPSPAPAVGGVSLSA